MSGSFHILPSHGTTFSASAFSMAAKAFYCTSITPSTQAGSTPRHGSGRGKQSENRANSETDVAFALFTTHNSLLLPGNQLRPVEVPTRRTILRQRRQFHDRLRAVFYTQRRRASTHIRLRPARVRRVHLDPRPAQFV